MVICEICGKELAPTGYSFPEDIREEKTYCGCIPWETMKQCIELSLDNAQRLVEDAEFLLKAGRLSSANVLAILSIEESGKALLGCEYFDEKKKISVKGRKGDYHKRFLNHPTKMRKALEAVETFIPQFKIYRKILGRDFAKELLEEKHQRMFVDYDGRFQMWKIPWSQDPRPLVKTYDRFMDLKGAEAIRKAQEAIDKVWTERVLIIIAKTAADCARQRFARCP